MRVSSSTMQFPQQQPHQQLSQFPFPNANMYRSQSNFYPTQFSVPSVTSVPSLPSLPSLSSLPSVSSVPSIPSIPSIPSMPSMPSTQGFQAAPAVAAAAPSVGCSGDKRKEERINISCLSLNRLQPLLSIYKPGSQTGINRRCGFDESSSRIRYVRSMTDIIDYPYRATKELAHKLLHTESSRRGRDLGDKIQKMYPHINNYFQYSCIAGEVYFITLHGPGRRMREFIIIVAPWKSLPNDETVYTIGESTRCGVTRPRGRKDGVNTPFQYVGHFTACELCCFLTDEIRNLYNTYDSAFDYEWQPKLLSNLPDVVEAREKPFDAGMRFDSNSLLDVLSALDATREESDRKVRKDRNKSRRDGKRQEHSWKGKKGGGNDAHKNKFFADMRRSLGVSVSELKQEIVRATQKSIGYARFLGDKMVVCQIYFHKCYFHSEFVLTVELQNSETSECHKFGIVFVEERGSYVFKQLLTPYMIFYNIGLNYPNKMGLVRPATLQWWPSHVFVKYYSFLNLWNPSPCNVTQLPAARGRNARQNALAAPAPQAQAPAPATKKNAKRGKAAKQAEKKVEQPKEKMPTINDVLRSGGKKGALRNVHVGQSVAKGPVKELKVGKILPWQFDIAANQSKFTTKKSLQTPSMFLGSNNLPFPNKHSPEASKPLFLMNLTNVSNLSNLSNFTLSSPKSTASSKVETEACVQEKRAPVQKSVSPVKAPEPAPSAPVRRNRGRAGKSKSARRGATASVAAALVVEERDEKAENLDKFSTWWENVATIQTKGNGSDCFKLLQVATLTLQLCQFSSKMCAKVDNNYNVCCELPDKHVSEFGVEHRVERFFQLLDYFTGAYGNLWVQKIRLCRQQAKVPLTGFDSIKLWLQRDVPQMLRQECKQAAMRFDANDVAAKKRVAAWN